MAYSRTPRVVEVTRPLLDEMVKSETSIEWMFEEPKKITYKLWEAIRYSTLSKREDLKEYASLLQKFRIRVIGDNIVKAELREEVDSVISPSGLIFREVVSVDEIFKISLEQKINTLIFPKINPLKLKSEDRGKLNKWCLENKYSFDIYADKLSLYRIVRDEDENVR